MIGKNIIKSAKSRLECYKKLPRKKKLQVWCFLFGMVFLLSYAVVMIQTFMLAYFNPDGSKTILVGINWVGEAHAELVLILLGIPFILYSYIVTFRRARSVVAHGGEL